MNAVVNYASKAALTSVMSALVLSAMLPKGMKVSDLPAMLAHVKKTNGSVNTMKILELMENEEQLALFLQSQSPETNMADQQTIATSTAKAVVIDQSELEAIDKMNISNELKAQMRMGYSQVGSMGGESIIERAPASVQADKVSLPTGNSYEESLRSLHSALTLVEQKPTN